MVTRFQIQCALHQRWRGRGRYNNSLQCDCENYLQSMIVLLLWIFLVVHVHPPRQFVCKFELGSIGFALFPWCASFSQMFAYSPPTLTASMEGHGHLRISAQPSDVALSSGVTVWRMSGSWSRSYRTWDTDRLNFNHASQALAHVTVLWNITLV